MPSKVAPPKNTGGGGFVFESDVCAWLLACMLAGEPPFKTELGVAERIDFQTHPKGWFLDDALVETISGSVHHRIALSIKSNVQFSAGAAPKDFVRCVWEQWLRIGSQVFNRSSDFMALVTTLLPIGTRKALNDLIEKVSVSDPASFPSQIITPGWASKEERSLFASFACPPDLADSRSVAGDEVARLLSRLRFFEHDFASVAAGSEKDALRICRSVLRSGDHAEAQNLWNSLRAISDDLRPKAGMLTRSGLVDRMRTRFALAEHPDHRADWAKLVEQSRTAATQVRNSIAGLIQIPRDADVGDLEVALQSSDSVVLLGQSGVGKSAVARQLFERRMSMDKKTLWFDAHSFERPDFAALQSDLQLAVPLSDLLRTAPDPDPVVVVDGLDRLFSDGGFRLVATLVRLARQPSPSAHWRVVVTCQSQEWPRVLVCLERAGVVGADWKFVEVRRLMRKDLAPVATAVPAIAKLLLQPKVAGLLTNLKVLDLVARRMTAGGDIDAGRWVGESSVAEWFWDAEVSRGQDAVARGRFVRTLAQHQADRLTTTVPVDDFNAADLGPLKSLAPDGICLQVRGDRIAFGHDLYGDWARLRLLINNQADLPNYLRNRLVSPLWHRAVRLYGIHLLDGASGIEGWRSALQSFGTDDFRVIHDLLLEAPIFAVNPLPLLEAIRMDLLANGGTLLRRMLTRFLAFATVPDPRMLALAKAEGFDEAAIRATHRVPHWPDWLDVLRFLHTHRTDVVAVVPAEVARVVELWLQYAPHGTVLRPEAADLGVMLGWHALQSRGVYGGGDWHAQRQRFYRCALASAQEEPDAVSEIALRACERRAPPVEEVAKEGETGGESPSPRRRAFGVRRKESNTEPWPDGPRRRVDDDFQTVVLDSPAICELFRVRPAEAREVILATLIEPPHDESWHDRPLARTELDLENRHSWHPPLYVHGPFLLCLQMNFGEGLELVARLVDFAAERWRFYTELDAHEWRTQAGTQGEPQASLEHLFRVNRPGELWLQIGDERRSFLGDARVYGWCAGLGNPPQPVEAALMALEQYFYRQLDDGKDIATEAGAVLRRGRSVAFLKVLSDVGKRHRPLFEGPLRPLLGAPEIYQWDIEAAVCGRTHMMIGSNMQGRWFAELARKFHGLEHRKAYLRDVAISLMLTKPGMREYFARTRAEWSLAAQQSPDGHVSPMVEQLSSALDPANWEVQEHPQHGTVLVNVEALRLQERRADEMRAMEERMLLSGFPIRCRMLIDEAKVLTDSELDVLWGQWCRIRELAREHALAQDSPESQFGDEFANALAGGIAVLVRHSEWIQRHAGRVEDSTATLRSILKSPPKGSDFDSRESVSTWTWDCFAGEALAVLWAQCPSDVGLRADVARIVFAPHYVAVHILFARCSERRGELGPDFGRLRRLVLEWAYVRDRVDMVQRIPREALGLDEDALERTRAAFASWITERTDAFVSGSMPDMPNDWSQCDDGGRFAELDAVRARWGRAGGIDFHTVRSAHEWLPLPERAASESERAEWLTFWRNALTVVLARPLASAGREEHQYPNEDEGWVLNALGVVVQHMRANEHPEDIWRAVLSLPAEAHDWPEVFAQAVHRHALASSAPPDTYASLVRDMVRHVFARGDGKGMWPYHEGVWDALVGTDGFTRDLWKERHQGVVTSLLDTFEKWMAHVPMSGRRLASFAAWLSCPAAVSLRVRSLPWFSKMLLGTGDAKLHDADEGADAVAALLDVIWREDEARVRSDAGAFTAFGDLLRWLAGKQNAMGLELLGRLGGLAC